MSFAKVRNSGEGKTDYNTYEKQTETCHPELDSGSNYCNDCAIADQVRNDGKIEMVKQHLFAKQTYNSLPSNPPTFLPSKKAAFTLAETLITLGIIGVVAALTMPSLIVKHQKLQTVTKFKKAYSELSQAIRISENKYGLLESWDFSNFDTPAERVNYFYENYLIPNLKIVKKCEPENQSECWADKVYNLDGDIKQDNEFAADGNRLTFITGSGMSYLYWLHGTGNGGWFWVDINGPKKGPNTLGKDIFPIVANWGNTGVMSVEDRCIPKRGIFPYGLHCMQSHTRTEIKNGFEVGGIFSYCCLKGSGKRNAGTNCGALIMYDSWQILPDYPW